MHEIVVNLHMHTRYSDGFVSHKEIAEAALQEGLEAVIITDHNIWVNGPGGYYHDGQKRVLLLVGEEVHDRDRQPQKNHLLVFGVNRDLAPMAHDTQLLLNSIQQAGGVAFIAHPVDPAAPAFDEPDISWEDWDYQPFTGIELWNGMSEFKSLLKNRLHAIYYAYNPNRIGHGPFPQALQLWDALLAKGRPVVAIGGSDAHAMPARMGPLRRTLFPYQFHFKTVNTHLLLHRPLSGEISEDQRAIITAFRQGHAFIGYDLPFPTRGFRFSAQGNDGRAWMGDTISVNRGVTLQIRLPRQAECLLLKDSQPIKTWRKREICTYLATEPGVYRVEAYMRYLGKRRGWIYSNPIYLKPG